MGRIGRLRGVKDQLIKEVEETTLSFTELGKKYRVSKQAVFEFAQRRGIKRPKRPKTEHTKNCSICQSLIKIAQKLHSDFISSQTIKKQLRLRSQTWVQHIRILKKKGLISPKFGRLRSRKAELAYQLYFTKRLSVGTIGRQVGLKNFYAILHRHRTSGWDVPASLLTYDRNERSKRLKMIKEKRRR